MYILKVESREEAKELCDSEPMVVGGYATYKLIDFFRCKSGKQLFTLTEDSQYFICWTELSTSYWYKLFLSVNHPINP